MMGPIAHTPKFSPGNLVKMKTADHGLGIGTIVDNFVDFHINSGSRSEQVLVLWSEGCSLWMDIKRLELISPVTDCEAKSLPKTM